MKLHLPKLLLTAVMAACVAPAFAADDTWRPNGDGQKLLGDDNTVIAQGDTVTIDASSRDDKTLAINGKSTHGGTDANGHYFTVEGTLDASDDVLRLESGAKMIIDGGSVTAGAIQLGFADSYSGQQDIWGAIEMTSGSLKTGTITLIKNWSNVVDIKGGSVEFTSAQALNTGNNSKSKINIQGASSDAMVKLLATTIDWTLDGGANVPVTVGNVAIDANNTHMITIKNAYLNGAITNNATKDGSGLTLSGAFTIGGGFYTLQSVGNTTEGFTQTITLTGLGTSDKTILSEGITFDGVAIGEGGWQKNDDGYYYRTHEKSLYHVYSDTIVANIGSSATSNFIGFEVHAGATLDMNGNVNTSGLTVNLQKGGILANKGGDISEGAQQLKKIALKGDATINAQNDFGLVAGAHAQAYLDLAGYKLTKTGSDIFIVSNTEVSAGTIAVQQGTLKFINTTGGSGVLSVADGTSITLASGTTLAIAGNKAVDASFLKGVSGAGKVIFNNSNVSVGQVTVAATGEHELQSGTLTLNGTTMSILKVKGASTLTANDNTTITKLYMQSTGQMNISNATIKNLRLETAGTLNITGTITSIGVAGETYDSRSAGLYAKNGTVNIGDGSTASTITVTRLELGDEGYGDGSVTYQDGGVLNVNALSTLVVKGSDNGAVYKNASFIISEWEQNSTVNISGNLYAMGAKALVGDATANVNIKDGGVMAVLGFGVADTTKRADVPQGINLTLNDGGKLILGGGGINTDKSFTGVLGAGEVGISAESVTIAEDIALSSASGTTFDTQMYEWGEGGASIAQGTEGGTLSISGVISDHSVTTTEGEGETATTTTTKYSGKLVKVGAGALELSGANTYSGGTDINAGTVKTGHASALGTGKVVMNGGTLQQNGAALTVSAMDYKSGTVDNGGQNLTVEGTLNVESKMEITGTGATSIGTLNLAAGATLTTSGALTLGSITLDLSGYAAGYSNTLVSATNGGISWNEDSWTYTGLGAGLMANVGYADESKTTLQLTISAEEEITSVNASVTGVVSYNAAEDMLTLQLDKEVTSGTMVSLTLITDERILTAIQSELDKAGADDMFRITVQYDDTHKVVAESFDQVVFYNEKGQGYWGEMVDLGGNVGTKLVYKLDRIPEPTTTTLSLLALMGLAARRRRQK